jgi:hypothetical protein
MSATIICNGCGARLTVPDGYTRNKMQCPECGVMCPVVPQPAARPKAEERPPVREAAPVEEENVLDAEPAEPPAPVAAIAKRPAPAKGLAECPRCGEMVRATARKPGKKRRCPACNAPWPDLEAVPPSGRGRETTPQRGEPPPIPVGPPPDEFAGSSPDDDPETSNPYRTADVGARRCPGCSDLLQPEVVLCTRCGFDLRTGRKVIKRYGPLECTWDSGMPLRTRLVLFLLCQAAALIAVGIGFITMEDDLAIAIPTFGLSWIIYTAMTAFLVGTFNHGHLKRYKSGRVDLSLRQRVGFIPMPPKEIDVRAHCGVTTGATANNSLVDWLIFLFLLMSAVFPAIVYWYCALYKINYTVTLTGEHQAPEELVYSGWSEEQMHEIRQALADALTL